MRKVTRFFGGIDLHSTVIQVSIVDESGDEVVHRRFQGSSLAQGKRVIAFLARWRQEGRFAVEAVGMNRWFVDGCLDAGLDVVVVDPAKLGLKMLGKKTDRRDAYEIARRLRMGDIDRNATTYYPTASEYGGRRVLRGRQRLVQMRQEVANQIRAVYRAHRRSIPGSRLWGKGTMEKLSRSRVGGPDESLLVRTLAGVLERIQSAIEDLDRRVREYPQERESVRRLEDLPQVSAQTAATLVYELGDLSRFSGSRAVASYAGLVPRVSQSGDRSHHGRLTRRGNPQLRWILGQWAVRLIAFDERAKRWARSGLRRMHRNKVRTALARRLLVGIYAAWRREEPFSLEACLASR